MLITIFTALFMYNSMYLRVISSTACFSLLKEQISLLFCSMVTTVSVHLNFSSSTCRDGSVVKQHTHTHTHTNAHRHTNAHVKKTVECRFLFYTQRSTYMYMYMYIQLLPYTHLALLYSSVCVCVCVCVCDT